jgi:NtrC-family two-component system sensor histidine kinase KinB
MAEQERTAYEDHGFIVYSNSSVGFLCFGPAETWILSISQEKEFPQSFSRSESQSKLGEGIIMLGIRQKLSLGFGGLLVIILIIGFQSIMLLTELGDSIDVILRENYRSVIACQDMKEALERIDSGILFVLLGYEQKGSELISQNTKAFRAALQVELHNITLPGEGAKADRIQQLFEQYATALEDARNSSLGQILRRETYFSRLFPLFEQIKATADEILHMNQQNMRDANERAREAAASARKRMALLLMIGVSVAAGFILLVGKWILRPIARLTASANEIKAGNLDLVVKADSKDEIGTLSEAFNAMAAGLRQFRRTNQARLHRIQRSTEEAFRFLPDGVAVVDVDGNIEVSSAIALDAFNLRPNEKIFSLPFLGVIDLFHQALRTGRVAEPANGQSYMQRFVQGEERYFRPRAIPILDAERNPTGVIVIISDVTQERYQDELKRGAISIVAHQLRTPLTSVRMALHLLLEEKVGSITEKQAELLVAAREDSDRLYSVLEQLLNISRIESGKAQIDSRPISPRHLVFESLEPFRRTAQDKGISLEVNLPDDLPEVVADSGLIAQVFANLISNALKYTNPGGKVAVSAQANDDFIAFSVSDTGIGIPKQYLQRILEQFFRVPGQAGDPGVGLGLSIVQQIVGAHGGTVNVESAEGAGSSFSFSLKRAAPSEGPKGGA